MPKLQFQMDVDWYGVGRKKRSQMPRMRKILQNRNNERFGNDFRDPSTEGVMEEE